MWLGINPIPADKIKGYVTDGGRTVTGRLILSLGGSVDTTAFKAGDGKVFRRKGSSRLPIMRITAEIPGAAEAMDRAIAVAEQELLDNFEKEAGALLGKA